MGTLVAGARGRRPSADVCSGTQGPGTHPAMIDILWAPSVAALRLTSVPLKALVALHQSCEFNTTEQQFPSETIGKHNVFGTRILLCEKINEPLGKHVFERSKTLLKTLCIHSQNWCFCLPSAESAKVCRTERQRLRIRTTIRARVGADDVKHVAFSGRKASPSLQYI